MVKVYLSPSTQDGNVGEGNYGTEEQRMNQVADVTQQVLERHGVKVFRNKPEWPLSQVVTDSNNKNPDIHFAIHSNAGGGRGCEVYCHKFGGQGEKLARAVYERLSPLTPTVDRGVHEGFNFYGEGKHMYELAYTNAPAALIEVGFHDNEQDEIWIVSNIEVIGKALAKGILDYFGIKFREAELGLNEALEILTSKGIISSPSYWKENAIYGKQVNGEYAGILIKRAAEVLTK